MRPLLRIALALALALALTLALTAGSASASASAAELPDLEQLAPYKVRVVERDGRWSVAAAAVQNVGTGALRIRGYGDGSGTMATEQLPASSCRCLIPMSGRCATSPRSVITTGTTWGLCDTSCAAWTPGSRPRSAGHQGFCLGEAPFVDGWCARDKPTLISTELGIRPGGTDIYEPNVEGQEIEIAPDTTPAGRYVLTSRVGPTGLLDETRTDNNAASTVIELRWPLTGSRELAPISSCIGEACAGAVPRAPSPRAGCPRPSPGGSRARHCGGPSAGCRLRCASVAAMRACAGASAACGWCVGGAAWRHGPRL